MHPHPRELLLRGQDYRIYSQHARPPSQSSLIVVVLLSHNADANTHSDGVAPSTGGIVRDIGGRPFPPAGILSYLNIARPCRFFVRVLLSRPCPSVVLGSSFKTEKTWAPSSWARSGLDGLEQSVKLGTSVGAKPCYVLQVSSR